ncbi:MAG: hypothetical protein KKC30_04930 [Proteobacteria bacterium]|nr:hypothetical protein [Pseudomonadota bacterium]MBU4384103.1 hypothetical protein [Pseudomonadota bacterium]MBU4606599.1 hypothetical protein [Pseudomonadota bacterium]MCG2763742.1 hypothetical protein [Desulfarculaceae bacterium]
MAFWKKDKSETKKYTFIHGDSEYDVTKEVSKLKNKGISSIKTFSQDRLSLVLAWASTMTNEYGALLENGTFYRPLEDLPCSKDDMKLALKLSIFLHKLDGNHSAIETIQTAYTFLSNFLPLTNEQAIQLQKYDQVMSNVNAMDDQSDAKSVAEALNGPLDAFIECSQKSSQEHALLAEEIGRFVAAIK